MGSHVSAHPYKPQRVEETTAVTPHPSRAIVVVATEGSHFSPEIGGTHMVSESQVFIW